MGGEAAETRAVVVLDSSVVIALLDRADPHFDAARAAIAVRAADDLRLPTPAYAEVLVRPTALGYAAQAKANLAALGFVLDPLTADGAEAAAELRARHRTLRFADALILGQARAAGADAFLTTDRALGSIDPVVNVVG